MAGNEKVHISFWFRLIYWKEAYMLLRKTENLVVSCKETGLQVNADTTKYMVRM
jgi:hypothetical protein